MEKLLNLFNGIAELSPTLSESIFSQLNRREIKKRDTLLQTGQVARSIYFVECGLIRSYYHFRNREVTSWIMKETDIIVSVESFFFQEPSSETIEALEDGELYWISFDQLDRIYKAHPEFNLHRAKILERYYAKSERRHKMRMKPAYDRYLYLIENDPDLVGRVPDKYIASYLGMTQSTLSLQRKKFSKARRKHED